MSTSAGTLLSFLRFRTRRQGRAQFQAEPVSPRPVSPEPLGPGLATLLPSRRDAPETTIHPRQVG
jgi:hypothetical protein